jgi:hypothetical protein
MRSDNLPVLVGLGVFAIFAVLSLWLFGPESCRDGWLSTSIGTQGACSWHGGVSRHPSALFIVYFVIAAGLAFYVRSWQRRRFPNDAHLQDDQWALEGVTALTLVVLMIMVFDGPSSSSSTSSRPEQDFDYGR